MVKMTNWIIAKNATYLYKNKIKVTLLHCAVPSATARELNITIEKYADFESAKYDCQQFDEANPGGDYGIFALEDTL